MGPDLRSLYCNTRRHPLALAATMILGLGLAGCSDDGGSTADENTTTTTEDGDATTTTEEQEEEDETTGNEVDEETTTTTDSRTPRKTEPTGPIDESGVESWQQTAIPHRGEIGDQFDYDCAADGELGSVWGTNVYTDDSSVCTSAVHVGLIDQADGGSVTIEIVEGQDSYLGSEANGVTTSNYGSWGASYFFPDADELPMIDSIEWSRNAIFYDAEVGEVTTVVCAADGAIGSVWGTETYTADSSICTAAVHAGLITQEDSGRVAFEMVEGLDEYEGTEANGVTSSDYAAYDSAFTFPEDQPDADD